MRRSFAAPFFVIGSVTMRKMKKISKSVGDTHKIAEEIVKRVAGSRDHFKKAAVVALFGELGSGKTSFVQGAAKALGISERVLSPTFIILRVSKIPRPVPAPLQLADFTHFIHIDCYRLNNSEPVRDATHGTAGGELKKLGWDDIVSTPQNIIFVEWAEKIEDILPKDTIKIHFTFVNENKREIEWETGRKS